LRFGNFRFTLPSPIVFMFFFGVNFVTPMCLCRRPLFGLDLRNPPLLTRTRTMMNPCLALYPRVRALLNLKGFTVLTIAGCLLHLMCLCLVNSSIEDFSIVLQASAIYLYNILCLFVCYNCCYSLS